MCDDAPSPADAPMCDDSAAVVPGLDLRSGGSRGLELQGDVARDCVRSAPALSVPVRAGVKRQRGGRGVKAAGIQPGASATGTTVAVSAPGEDVLGHLPGPLRRLQVRMKALGMHQRQVVFELHVRQGRSLQVVAEVLGVDYKTAWGHWQKLLEEMVVLAPRDTKALTSTREQIAARLWATVEDTYARAEVLEDGEPVAVELPATPPMLSVRLKALDQISKLYGVNMERGDAAEALPPYAMPEEIAATVRLRVLEMWGRKSEE